MAPRASLPLLVLAAFALATLACTNEPTTPGPDETDALLPSPVGDANLHGARSGPRSAVNIRATNLTTAAGDPGSVGDRLSVDVEGPSLRDLSGRAWFRNASGETTRFVINSSLITDGELALFDDDRCPTGESEVITLILDGFQQGAPRAFVHLCDGTTLSVFDAALNGAGLDRVLLDVRSR